MSLVISSNFSVVKSDFICSFVISTRRIIYERIRHKPQFYIKKEQPQELELSLKKLLLDKLVCETKGRVKKNNIFYARNCR